MILFLFDPMDYDEDKELVDNVLKETSIAYKVAELHTIDDQNLSAFSHVFFDYGGFGLGNSMAEHFEERVTDVAREHPSVKFVAILTIGRTWYENVLKEPNVTNFDRMDLKDLPYYLEKDII